MRERDLMKLCAANLPTLRDGVGVPSYDRHRLTPAIVHFGIGNFHRAHQGVYLDELFNRGLDFHWGLIGAGVRPADAEMRAKLSSQDWLTTVVAQGPENSNARVTGGMIDFIQPGEASGIIAALADPRIRIVSLTITEGGYFIDPASECFDAENGAIIADARNPQHPQTVFGLILAGLRHRREAGRAPFTVLSCDNVPGNGRITRNAVVGLAELVDPELARWAREHVAFPNSMVDRITPATTDEHRAFLRSAYEIEDAAPVFCEDFSRWVVEDHFPAGRPALEEVGVELVGDAAPFELMKLRILNGSHAAIAYPGALMDVAFVHECLQQPLLRGFVEKLLREEILPTVRPAPNTDLEVYARDVLRRFANPKIADTVARLCVDGSNRQPKFILPIVADRLRAEHDVAGLALVAAFWCRYCEGRTDSGAAVNGEDPAWARMQQYARRSVHNPAAWLEMSEVFGEVGVDLRYRAQFGNALSILRQHGTREALRRYIAGTL
jgi:mannitol 2-dehydrogenase